MKAIVCGGRKFSDWFHLIDTLDAMHRETPFDCIVTGAAPGADTLAWSWAASRGIKVQNYPALWRTYGNAAGPIRNQKMLDDEKPDLVIAFPGGTGTADMTQRAEAAGVPVRRIAPLTKAGKPGSGS